MKTKKEVFPDFQKDYNEYLLVLQQEENAKKLEDKKAKQEEEKTAKDQIKAKAKEWDDFLGYGDEDDKVYAGGDNQYLEDDFM